MNLRNHLSNPILTKQMLPGTRHLHARNNCTIDDSPFRQTLELGIFIGTAGKSILNLVKWGSLVAKHCKM